MSSKTDDEEKKLSPTKNKNLSIILDNLIDIDNSDTMIASAPTLQPAIVNQDEASDKIVHDPIAISKGGETDNESKTLDNGDTASGELSKDEESLTVCDNSSESNSINQLSKDYQDTETKINDCDKCSALHLKVDKISRENIDLEAKVTRLMKDLESTRRELDREVQRRVDLDQRFTEEAKRTTEQIEEFIVKSDRDDARFNELRKKFETYSRETSSMIENFTTNREVLASQLLDLREENNYLLGKYLSSAQELQRAEIDLPQTVEELQFHCLTLNEKLILTTLAKERLEETLLKNSSVPQSSNTTPASTSMPP